MCTNAEIIVFGPLGVITRYNMLLHPEGCYFDCSDHTVVAGCIAKASTIDESELLAEIAGVDMWDFSSHHLLWQPTWIAGEMTYPIGAQRAGDVYDKLVNAISMGLDVWFLPNG